MAQSHLLLRSLLLTVLSPGAIGLCKAQSESPLLAHFSIVRQVTLPSEPLVGRISSLDISLDGRFLITDQIGQQVLLLDVRGNLIQSLDVNSCAPGNPWNPSDARFARDGTILVSNLTAPYSYRFSNDGECTGYFNDTNKRSYCFGSNELMYTTTASKSGILDLIAYDLAGRESLRFTTLPRVAKEYENLLGRFQGGNLACDGMGHVYEYLLVSPDVYVYDERGALLRIIDIQTPYYQQVNNDIPGIVGDIGRIQRALSHVLEGKSLSYRLFLLGSNTLLLEYQRTYGTNIFNIVVTDMEGRLLYDEEVAVINPFIFAGNGLAYRVVQPAQDSAGSIPNPRIDVYRLVR